MRLEFFVIALAMAGGIACASSLFSITAVSGNVYQNTNSSSPLYIYSYGGSTQSEFIGSNTANMIQVGNLPSTIVVPPSWYYTYVYTSSPTFYGEYSDQFTGQTGSFAQTATQGLFAFAVVSWVALFAFAMFFFLRALLDYMHKRVKR